jgi:glycerophosphoryl diester phosphodiesterase
MIQRCHAQDPIATSAVLFSRVRPPQRWLVNAAIKFLLPVLAFNVSSIYAQPELKPLVIAHRGASGYLPEHTIAAKAYAHALGAHFIEQDLVLSKDDVPIVLHDIYVDTVTDVASRFPKRKRADGRYYALDFTVAELKQLRVTERFNAKTGKRVFPQRFPAHQSSFELSTFEEELQLIQGLNRSTRRVAGIYPEIKQPKWHRAHGHDISRVVLAILARYGYATKSDACFLQCFELPEVRRLRNDLGWRGRLIMLIESKSKGDDGTDHDFLSTAAGVKEIAKVADGIGPAIGRLVTWPATSAAPEFTDLVKLARAEKLMLHPYTVRIDDLPNNCPSADALHHVLFNDLRVEGVFTDFPDVTAAWLNRNVNTAR